MIIRSWFEVNSAGQWPYRPGLDLGNPDKGQGKSWDASEIAFSIE